MIARKLAICTEARGSSARELRMRRMLSLGWLQNMIIDIKSARSFGWSGALGDEASRLRRASELAEAGSLAG